MSKLKIIEPHHFLIEHTAGAFAATFFEAARSSGMKTIMLQGQKINLMRYKENPRLFAKAHLEKFIPAATHSLIEIMSRENTPASQKEQIYQAILERTNDPDLDMMAKTAGDLPAFEQTVLYKPDNEKPKPVIINTPSIDFNFNSKKV